MKVLMFLVMFLLLGGFFIISENGIRLNGIDGVDKFLSLYGGWVDGLVVKGFNVGGYVVKMGWLPEA